MGEAAKSNKVLIGVLAIVLGGLGIHKFMLGYTKEGIITLCVTLLSCGMLGGIMGIIGVVEGIIYLTKSDEDFQKIYVEGKKAWF